MFSSSCSGLVAPSWGQWLSTATHDAGGHVGVEEGPREREVGHARTDALGDLGERLDLGDLGLALLRLELLDGVGEEGRVGRKARALGHAVVVLAREDTRVEGRPDGRAVATLEHVLVLDLEALAVQHRVVGLLAHGADHVEAGSNLLGLGDLGGGPLRSAPVVRLVVVDEPVERAHNLLHGGGDVWAVRKDHVDVVELQALETVLRALDDVLAAEAARVLRLLAPRAEEDLGGDDNVTAVPVQLLDHTAHLELAVAVRVHLGVLPSVNAGRI